MKYLMKSLSIFLLVFTLMNTSIVFGSDSTNHEINLNAKSYTADVLGENPSHDTLKNSEVVLSNIQLSQTNVSVVGDVYSNGVTKSSFNLTGKLTRSEYPGKLVGDLIDTDNNYEVIYLGIEKRPEENIGFFDDSNGKTTLKIYLLEKGTKNLTVYEDSDITQRIDVEALFNDSKNYELAKHENEFWYGKVFKPASAKTSTGFSTLALASGHSDVTHTLSYNIGGLIIYEDITLRAYIEGPTALDNSGGTFTTKFYVLSESTHSTDYPSANSSQTNFTIGSATPTKIEAYTEPGDYFRYVQWDGSYYQSGSLNFTVKVSYKIPGTWVSFSTGYTNAETFPSKSLKTFDNSGTNKARIADVEYATGMQLKDVGNTFDTIFAVGHYNTNTTKNLNIRWSYDVFNSQNYLAFGAQTKSMYFSYTSK
ncbi:MULTISPECIES: hypothetical protein [Paenibacillus]|uniref:hypothetical protein n=1 Tax=Paenibacillus TaxID=44249 RepID=UPI00117CD42E|nr:hypothetical protein [Paenibacillus sp. FSL H8-0259]